MNDATVRRLRRYAYRSCEDCTARLAELDEEWDVRRWCEAVGATAAGLGLAIGLPGRGRGLALTALGTGLLLQHALQGDCLLAHALRRLGVRTRREIEAEKFGLKALRGDFEGLRTRIERDDRARAALAAATR